jgi:SsrA-binding protein
MIRNRAAFHNYEILESFECGVALLGTEVKSIREGKANLTDAYALVKDGEVWLLNAHVSPYTHGNRMNHEPRRTRKLLMHKAEINRLSGRTVEKGLTLVPTKMYFKDGRVKVEIGLARGKKNYDKRETEMRKTIDRETQAALKDRR